MSLANNAIPGEASESDSEEEINTISEKDKVNVSTPQGRIVAGEAPESDEEIADGGSVSSAASVSSITSLTSSLRGHASPANAKKVSTKSRTVDEIKYKTLLHKKLRERNMSLWKNITDLVHLNVIQASRDLNTADQQLLRSQGVLQETAAQLRVIDENLAGLRDKLGILTATPFLPHVTLPPP